MTSQEQLPVAHSQIVSHENVPFHGLITPDDDFRLRGFVGWEVIPYAKRNALPDKEGVTPKDGARHIYGLDENGKKIHLSHDKVLESYGYGMVKEELKLEMSVFGAEQLPLPNMEALDENEPTIHAFGILGRQPKQATVRKASPAVIDQYPHPIQEQLPLQEETEIHFLGAAGLGIALSRALRERKARKTNREAYLTKLETLSVQHDLIAGLPKLGDLPITYETNYYDSDTRKRKGLLWRAAMVGALVASALFLSKSTGNEHESAHSERPVTTTVITEAPVESVPDVSVTPTTAPETPVTAPTPTNPEAPEQPQDDTSPPDTTEPTTPALDVGVAIIAPADGELAAAVRTFNAEPVIDIGEPAAISFSVDALPWVNAVNLGVEGKIAFIQRVLDAYNAQGGRKFVWNHADGMFYEGEHIMNLAELKVYNKIMLEVLNSETGEEA